MMLVAVPFAPEVCFLTSLLILSRYYRYKKRFWSAPFRVPAYLKYLSKRQYIDETTGRTGAGDVYLGYCLETKREVWASLDDVRTHRLTVGTTGSGKTEEFLAEIFNAFVHDSGVMFVDGKGEKKGSLAGTLKLARLFWRDEDVYQLNYVMGGQDAQLFRNEKRSNTFNPLQNMGSSAMTEILVSRLSDSGGGDSMWQDRAISLLQGLIPPLNYLSTRGYLLFNAEALARFFPLHCIEDLYCHQAFIDHNGNRIELQKMGGGEDAAFLKREYLGALQTYLENLPGWSKGPDRPFVGREESKDAKAAQPPAAKNAEDPSRAKALEQHGYLTMQVVKPIVDLSFNYGHNYNVQVGEIDFRDIAQNRRILVSLLPALERSTANMQPLGKMTVAAVKNVLATGLAGPVSGSWRQVMSSQEVARGPVPFFMLCDEYGYYVVEGFAVAPAQARSLGYSITFGVQDIDSLMKSNQNEGAATIENTNIAMVGRMTGGKDSSTFQVAAGRAGEAYVQEVEDLMHHTTGSGTTKLGVERSRLAYKSRIDYQDMAAQKDGDFHMIIGTPVFTRKGVDQEVRIVRMKCFYTGAIPQPDAARPLDLAYVTPLSVTDKTTILAEVKLQKIISNGTEIGISAARMMAEKTKGALYRIGTENEMSDAIVPDVMEYLLAHARRLGKTVGDYQQLSAVSVMKTHYHALAATNEARAFEERRATIRSYVERRSQPGFYRRSLVGLVGRISRDCRPLDGAGRRSERRTQTGERAAREIGAQVEGIAKAVVSRRRADRSAPVPSEAPVSGTSVS
jgi:intracellular multiplication protein IcmO